MAAAAAFREGQVLYEFSESLFNAPPPPGLSEEQVDEYRFHAGRALRADSGEARSSAFTLALRNALDKDGVYNKWSRLSAEFAAKVNPDEFPISSFTVKPDKTKDTLSSTSFIKIVSRGDTVVDFSGTTRQDRRAHWGGSLMTTKQTVGRGLTASWTTLAALGAGIDLGRRLRRRERRR